MVSVLGAFIFSESTIIRSIAISVRDVGGGA